MDDKHVEQKPGVLIAILLTYVNVSVVRFVLLQFAHSDLLDHILLDILAKPKELVVKKVYVVGKLFGLFLYR